MNATNMKLAERIENLSPRKRALLARRLAAARAEAPAPPAAAGTALRLVAYAVAKAGERPTAEALRDYLLKKLPEYMVPAAFVFLDDLPRRLNGKLDLEALPAPERTTSQEEGFVPPRSPLEETLAKIWGEVLNFDEVGVNDNFFEMGGHSLLVTQLVSRLREAFDIELPVASVFDAPTIAELGVVVEQRILAEIEEIPEDEARDLAGSSDGPVPP